MNETEQLAADIRALIKRKEQEQKDEALMQLVQRQSVSLASLYRKGKARGLISSSGGYGG